MPATNDRDIVMEPDLPLTKGFLEHMRDCRRYDEEIALKSIREHLAIYPPLERALSAGVEAMLPEIVGTLAMLAGKTMKIIDPEVTNPDSANVGTGLLRDGLVAIAGLLAGSFMVTKLCERLLRWRSN